MSLNRYAYVQGNPVNWTDPLGYGPEICAAALIAGPEAAAACLAGVAIIAVGGVALAYLAFQASRSRYKINIYSPGTPGNLSLDQAIRQYSQAFNSLERARSQDCSGLTPGGDRERCNQRYAQREREALEQTVIPGFIGEADYVLQEAERIVEEAFRQPQPQPEPGQTMVPRPYIPPLPPTLCSPTATATATTMPSIYRLVEPGDLPNPTRAAALRAPLDYITGFSFFDSVGPYRGTPNDTGTYLKCNPDTLRTNGFAVQRDTGIVVQIPSVSLADIAGLYTPTQEQRIQRILGGGLQQGHYSVYTTNTPYWTNWFKDEYAAKQNGNVSPQTTRFFNLCQVVTTQG